MAKHDTRYDSYRTAAANGGPCAVCGWRDGDGVKECFYSTELGSVVHQNTMASAEAAMTEAQRTLVNLRFCLAFRDAASRDAYNDHVAAEHRARRIAHEANYPDVPFCVKSDGSEWSDEDWIANFARQNEQKPLATDEAYSGWIRESAGAFDTWMVHLYEPHPGCGGTQDGVGPYHLRCGKCGVEVKLWEFGIDYDIG